MGTQRWHRACDGHDTAPRLLDEGTTTRAGLHASPARVRVTERSEIANSGAFPGGYVGESTSREIAYAHATGKPISFTDPV
ncbi:hypothetical protein [Streptomyces sp. NBC_01426]|uniref:hypothetical protein n=1 Tax=Streptomyces sp. NBC_01426 TaxID=2975866 RepID=UPI003FCD8BF5